MPFLGPPCSFLYSPIFILIVQQIYHSLRVKRHYEFPLHWFIISLCIRLRVVVNFAADNYCRLLSELHPHSSCNSLQHRLDLSKQVGESIQIGHLTSEDGTYIFMHWHNIYISRH